MSYTYKNGTILIVIPETSSVQIKNNNIQIKIGKLDHC